MKTHQSIISRHIPSTSDKIHDFHSRCKNKDSSWKLWIHSLFLEVGLLVLPNETSRGGPSSTRRPPVAAGSGGDGPTLAPHRRPWGKEWHMAIVNKRLKYKIKSTYTVHVHDHWKNRTWSMEMLTNNDLSLRNIIYDRNLFFVPIVPPVKWRMFAVLMFRNGRVYHLESRWQHL